MPEPIRDFPFGHRLPTDMSTQIRATTEPGVDHPHRPRIAALVVVLAVIGGLSAVASPPADVQVLSTETCGTSWVTEEAGHVWVDAPSSCWPEGTRAP